MRLMYNVARFIFPGPPCDGANGYLVYRIAGGGEIKDAWESRIVELGNGRSIGEITEILYREEIMAGASVVDIGIWKASSTGV